MGRGKKLSVCLSDRSDKVHHGAVRTSREPGPVGHAGELAAPGRRVRGERKLLKNGTKEGSGWSQRCCI